MNDSKKNQKVDPLNDPNREYVVGLIKAIGGVEKTISNLENSPTVTILKALQEKLESGNDVASFMWSLLRGPRGEKGDSIKGDPGERGLPGPQGLPGKNADEEALYRRLLKAIPEPIPGKRGEPGQKGADAVVDYAKIIDTVIQKLPKNKDAKKELLKISVKDIADFPEIGELVRKYVYDFSESRASNTIVAPGGSHLRGLLDVSDKDIAVGFVPTWNGTQFVFQAPGSLGYTAEDVANKGVADGYASLDGAGKVPASQLPSYVDDVLEYADVASLPGTGETAKIYVTLDTNKTYRWSGSAYVEISPSPGSTDSVTEGSTNLYFTVARVLASVLTGFSVGSRVAITASDTVLSAFGKAQKYFNDLSALAFSGSASDLTGTKTSSFISDFSTAVASLITGKSDVGHTHSASDITSGTKTSSFISDFSSAVASLITGKSDVGHVHSASDITSGTKTSSFISDFSSAVASLITGKLDSSAYDDATSAETTTGTSTSKYVSPDGLAGSDYGKRIVGILVVDPATDVATGDGKAFFRIPSALNGYNLVGVAMNVYTAGTTGTMDVQIRNVTDSQDMLSTKLTIDSTETDTSTAVTPAVINTSFDDVATGDKISIDVDAVQTTKAKGLYVELIFQLP